MSIKFLKTLFYCFQLAEPLASKLTGESIFKGFAFRFQRAIHLQNQNDEFWVSGKTVIQLRFTSETACLGKKPEKNGKKL